MNQVEDIFIFIGPPGAGKGSLARLCLQHFDWIEISTGNLCRKHILEQTKIGKEIDLIIKSGKLINDDLMTFMVFEWFNENAKRAKGIIFDGYPRTIDQAISFDNMIHSRFPSVRLNVVWFVISNDVVIRRLCSRYICQNKECQAVYSLSPESSLAPSNDTLCDICSSPLGRREDDNESAVRKRLEIYHKHEEELIGFYKKTNHSIIELDASASLQEVFDNFVRCINKINR